MASLQSSMYLIKVKTRKTFYRGREIKVQKSHLCHVSLSDLTALLEICQYEIPEESAKWKIRMTEAEMAGKSCCLAHFTGSCWTPEYYLLFKVMQCFQLNWNST